MPALPRQEAAKDLGISVSKLRRLTADGTGKVRQGRRGRGCPTLYDVTIIGTLLHTPPAGGPSHTAAPLERGALASTLVDSLLRDLDVVADSGELHRYEVPLRNHRKLVAFIGAWIASHVESHLRLNRRK